MRRLVQIGMLMAAVAALSTAEGTVLADSKQRWHRTVSLGFHLTSGNSDTLMFTTALRAEREWERDAWRLGADAAIGQTDGETTTERAGGNVEYKRLFDDRWYGSVNVSLLHDSIADIEYRLTLGPSMGYYFIKTHRTRLSAEIGPSYVREKLGHDVDDYVALRVGQRFERQLSLTAKLWQSLEFMPQVNDLNNYLLNAEVGIEAALIENLSLRVVVQDKYDNEPAPGKQSNDIAVISSLVYRF